MTEVSLNFRQAAYAQETGRVLILLVTIDHEDLTEPIRLSTDPTQELTELTTATEKVYGTISRGETYIHFPIRIGLPSVDESGFGELVLEVDNIHRAYTETIRTIFTPATVTVELVMDNTLDVVEASWPEFSLTEVSYDAFVISGKVRMDFLQKEPFPAGTFSPAYFKGMFI